MSDEISKKTAETAALYFEGVSAEKPYELWKSFDRGLAKDLSLFITGQMYAREVLPHSTRQMVAVAALTVLEKSEELELHLQAAKIIAGGLKDLGIMKGDVDEAVAAGAHALFFPHGLGHMMGLDVHAMEGLGKNNVEYNDVIKRSDQFGLAYLRMGRELEPGFVMTNEPGCYFIPALIDQWKSEKKFEQFINYRAIEPYLGFGGVRIEDDILVTDSGSRVLGTPIPKTVAEVEATMNS